MNISATPKDLSPAHQFIALLKKIESAGAFSTFGKLDPIFPGIVIDNVGEISLPLSEHQAKKIIEQCELAPFGRGEETILDTSVRNVWQISPTTMKFTNQEWDQVIAKACDDISRQLGLTECRITFELYKVLVYAKGSFFLEHRDTEKIPNMFATMVINLPSTHEGGELIIRHGGETNQYTFAGKSKFHAEYAAFYADCYHEVKPITSGYRFSLIYNLAIVDREKQPLLSHQAEIVNQLDAYLQNWCLNNNEQPMLTYLLDHSYTEQNLSITNLKKNDFARASTLFKLAEKNQCKAFLCLVSYNRESYGDCDYDGGYRSRKRGYGYDESYDEISESSFHEYDISNEETYAHYFISPLGEKIDIAKLSLEENDIFAEIPLCEGPGREVSISEATGNAGATKELWYHRGAIIMWPANKDFELLFKIDIGYAIHYFKRLIQNEDLSKEVNREKATQLAHHIINSQNFDLKNFARRSRMCNLNEIIGDLIALNNPEILRKFLKIQSSYGLRRLDPKSIVQILDRFSWHTFDNELSIILTGYENSYKVLEALQWLLNVLLEKPVAAESYPIITKWFEKVYLSVTSLTKIDEIKIALSYILQILILLKNEQFTENVLQAIQEYKKPRMLPYIYTPVLIEILNRCAKENSCSEILEKIIEDFLSCAEASYNTAPTPPTDWSRSGQLKCDCTFCKEVNKLLPDPQRFTLTVEKTLKRNLQHIEAEIKREGLDLSIHIDRQSTNFKGTITKNQNSYEEALTKFSIIEQARKSINTSFSLDLRLQKKSVIET